MLDKNALLVNIVRKLQQRPFPMEDAVASVLAEEYEKGRYPSPSQVGGRLGEIGMQMNITDICSEYEDRVIVNPIDIDIETTSYQFRYTRHGSIEVIATTGKQITDYDYLVLVDNLPVIFEVKLSNGRCEGCSDKRRGPSNNKLSYFLKQENIDRVTKPVQEYFRTSSCGYVIITFPQKCGLDTPLKQEFVDSGGLFVPFPMTRQEYRQSLHHIFQSGG